MYKLIRKEVRCYLIKNNNVVATKYKQGNKESILAGQIIHG